MSIYSGFATRTQENQYNKLVDGMVMLLKNRLIKFYLQKPTDEKQFAQKLQRLVCNMKHMESYKFLSPKYGNKIDDLIEILEEMFSLKSENPNHSSLFPPHDLCSLLPDP